jgi:hypothetical protein
MREEQAVQQMAFGDSRAYHPVVDIDIEFWN